MVFSATSCSTRNTSPTIELKIYEGPDYITGFCVYRVEAIVTGYPEPEVSFSKDDSYGTAGEYMCQINLENPQEPYQLEATATNTSGVASSLILLEWGCEEEIETYLETVQEPVVKEEEIIEEQPSYFDNIEDKILFIGDSEENRVFPDTLYIEEVNPKAESLKPEERERSMELMIKSQKKYFEDILWNNLTKTYVLDYLELVGVPHGGTNYPEGGIVYLINKGKELGYTDFVVEILFHSEFSSVLLGRNSGKMNMTNFREFNPAGFEYLGSNLQAIRDGKSSTTLDSNLHEIGFLCEYAQSSYINDFNSLAEYIFMGDKNFWEVYDTYPLIKAKTGLVIEFYHNLNSGFTYDYFKGFCETYEE